MTASSNEKPSTNQESNELSKQICTSSSLDKPLKVNDRCDVFWRGGHDHLPAVIVERRPSRIRRKLKRRREVDDDIENLPADDVEYYVHYVHHDRRLDEWVTLDKFKLETLQRFGECTDTINADPLESTDSKSVQKNERATRRRTISSMNPTKNAGSAVNDLNYLNTSNHDSTTFALTGGNWHGGGGHGSQSNDPVAAAYEREHEETTKVKNIEKIVMGHWEVEAWYYSPFPDEYSDIETLFVCDYCLSYMRKLKTYRKHRAECTCRQPPGTEIYRENDLCVFEVDGKEHKAYCQKLCLLAKLFLDHKTLYYDVTPFYFYVITKVDSEGAHIVGYFSKEKMSPEEYNLACILTFPQYQQAGYGKFIISLSYELTKREGKTGSPEKPLSDLGKVSYRSYWTHILMHILAEYDTKGNMSITDISIQTGIKTEDLISTLQYLDMIKVWKGQHVIYVKQDVIEEYMKQDKKMRLCNSEFLKWTPPSERN